MGGGNAAVQAVGRTFFRITLLGYTLSGLAMFPSVILGIRGHYFTWEMDRCACVLDDGLASGTGSSATGACVVGDDLARVNIGWKKFTYDELKHTSGCPEATASFARNSTLLKSELDKEQSFGAFTDVYNIDGVFQKTDFPTQADETNGGAEAGGGVVAMQVVLSFFSIFTYKMLKASYISNGSHCSVGLGLMTRLNALVGVGTAAALVSYWWLIEGRFGDEDKALTTAIEDVSFISSSLHSIDRSDVVHISVVDFVFAPRSVISLAGLYLRLLFHGSPPWTLGILYCASSSSST